MAIQTKGHERILNMAQMHQVGVLQRGPNLLWTCQWDEDGIQSSVCYDLVKNETDQSLKLRFRYDVLKTDPIIRTHLDYKVSIQVSRNYKQKAWYWFICPLIINGKPCGERVRDLYFLPDSEYFGCKNCRDMMIRSLPANEKPNFWQTEYNQDLINEHQQTGQSQQKETGANADNGANAPHTPPTLNLGWRPPTARETCLRCGCLSEGFNCCNCGAPLNDLQGENLFEVLGLDFDADKEHLRAAFMARMKEYHPDRVASLGIKIREVAEREVKNINLAYETLSDPERRQAYLIKNDPKFAKDSRFDPK